MDRFDCVSPLDFRYYDETLRAVLDDYVTERARVRSEAMVEAATTRVLARMGVCSEAVADEVAHAAEVVTPEEVAEEEARMFLSQWTKVLKVLAGNLEENKSPYAPLVRLVENRAQLVKAAA